MTDTWQQCCNKDMVVYWQWHAWRSHPGKPRQYSQEQDHSMLHNKAKASSSSTDRFYPYIHNQQITQPRPILHLAQQHEPIKGGFIQIDPSLLSQEHTTILANQAVSFSQANTANTHNNIHKAKAISARPNTPQEHTTTWTNHRRIPNNTQQHTTTWTNQRRLPNT